MKRRYLLALCALLVSSLCVLLAWGVGHAQQSPLPAFYGSKEGSVCIGCHSQQNAALVYDWRLSRMGQAGVNCYDCHRAQKGDPDAFEHNGFLISVIVSPKKCGRCHPQQVVEQQGSHHAKAGQILASLDNYLGEVVGGPPAVAVGCVQCHGSQVKVLPGGKFDPTTWPNSGIGRINPDGSWGSCTACHTRHAFSVAQARRPEACGKCHLGPDHPQIEVYQESKHGILFEAFQGRMNLDRRTWVAGVDYTAAPTCASCHMSATPSQGVTHDVGERISWTLRPAVSTRISMVVFEDHWKEDLAEGAPLPKVGENIKTKDGTLRKVAKVVTWEQRRQSMRDVCDQCHASEQIGGFYKQFDDLVDLYNEKFAKPATAIMDELYKAKKLTPAPMDEKLEWTYFELWHHEGRRARHGAAMSGPDYAWWHGIYDVAKNFYTEFLPEVRAVAGEPLATQLMNKYVYSQPGNQWLKQGMTKEQLQKMQEFYKKRYGPQN